MTQARFLGIPAPVWEKEFAPTHSEWDRKSYEMHQGKECVILPAETGDPEEKLWYALFDDGFVPTDPLSEKFFSLMDWKSEKEDEA